MKSVSKWAYGIIALVLIATCYNILPTVIFYTQSLEHRLSSEEGKKISSRILERTSDMENESIEWLKSYTSHLKLSPKAIAVDPDQAQFIHITFNNDSEAKTFYNWLSHAGIRIPFAPAQMGSSTLSENNIVTVQRKVFYNWPKEDDSLFHFTSKQVKGMPSEKYLSLIETRLSHIIEELYSSSLIKLQAQALNSKNTTEWSPNIVHAFCAELINVKQYLPEDLAYQKRLTQFIFQKPSDLDHFTQSFKHYVEKAKSEEKKLQAEGNSLHQVPLLDSILNFLESLNKLSIDEEASLNSNAIKTFVSNAIEKYSNERGAVKLPFTHPLFEKMKFDLNHEKISFEIYEKLQKELQKEVSTEKEFVQKEYLQQSIFNEMARITQSNSEKVQFSGNGFDLELNQIAGAEDIFYIDLAKLYENEAETIKHLVKTYWNPKHPSFEEKELIRLSANEFLNSDISEVDKAYSLIFVPGPTASKLHPELKTSSHYVVLKGYHPLAQSVESRNIEEEVAQFSDDIQRLSQVLHTRGFVPYLWPIKGDSLEGSLVFESSQPATSFIETTREPLLISGDGSKAFMEISNKKQQLKQLNQIETQKHEELLKWRDDFSSAQVSMEPKEKYKVAPPTKSPFWSNIALTTKKYLRGDEGRVLKWGLDLWGGKTVRIALFDTNQRQVKAPEQLSQARGELLKRVNRMGLSEVAIRIEGDYLVLDFPSSQGYSANELIESSSMTFHVVNERFNRYDPKNGPTVERFLQNVWNEARITHKTDIHSLNEIAARMLGYTKAGEEGPAQNEAAKSLKEAGLKLSFGNNHIASNALNEEYSLIVPYRMEDEKQWQESTHPLLIVFKNYALEGSNLDNVHASFDAQHGNTLVFGVKSKNSVLGTTTYPQDDFHKWTSEFSIDSVAGTSREASSNGRGWRMAVLLNQSVISAPTLSAALKDGGVIFGGFSQREVNKLAADLKAGSLTFTPKILSEENVSPELGSEDRSHGLIAASIALLLVIITMSYYYRFAGGIASLAVFCNLLIIWAVMQNLGAAMTLPGLAGIVLTMGMAVDANVLVFERIKEELKKKSSLPLAIENGYSRAFSAIIDSNITTILAAFILIQFDSGPIKGFAMTLIIGITSSMFTALFLTRTLFQHLLTRGKLKVLNMCDWISNTQFKFLNKAKWVGIFSLIFMLSGLSLFWAQRNNLLGMDFTGGYGVNIEYKADEDPRSYRKRTIEALETAGMSSTQFEVRELNRASRVRIQISQSSDLEGGVFHNIDSKATSNPRLNWVVNALNKSDLKISSENLEDLENTWMSVSGQFSNTMRNNALIAVGIALVAILIYITVRFEFIYAISSVLGLAYDVLMTLSAIAWLRFMGLPMQIDLQAIGAIMTIIGYALNDTIIVFDRIREEVARKKAFSFTQVVDQALNTTLSRTLITSGTTLIVLLTLVLLGGANLFAFSSIMTLGVVIGTFCSLYVTSWILDEIHRRSEES